MHDGLVKAVRITRCPGASTACVQVSTEGHVPVVHANEEAVEIARLVSENQQLLNRGVSVIVFISPPTLLMKTVSAITYREAADVPL